MNNIQI